MSHSSTSSSERGTRWARAAVVVLAFLVIVEVVLRLPPTTAALGPPQVYYHGGVQPRIEALDTVLRTEGRIDVLFVGSSVARTNISPHAFDETLAEYGIDAVSFNAGLSGLPIDAARLYLEHVWLPAARPRTVVQIVRYDDLADAPAARDFTGFTSGKYERLWIDGSPLAEFQETALRFSAILQRAGWLRSVLSNPTPGGAQAFAIDDRGFGPATGELSELERERAIDTIPGGAEIVHGFGAPLGPDEFRDGLAYLAATADAVRSAGAEFIVVNMPEHGARFASSPDGQARYLAYLAALESFAAAHHAALIDLAPNGLEAFMDDALFSDYIHLGPYAATDLSRDLADAVASLAATDGRDDVATHD